VQNRRLADDSNVGRGSSDNEEDRANCRRLVDSPAPWVGWPWSLGYGTALEGQQGIMEEAAVSRASRKPQL